MSEYQYYEFQAIDRALGEADRAALRALSTRARITATSFVNSYEWGDFKGDPAKLMDRWFDLHLYLADWGTRRLMIRLPRRLVDLNSLDGFLGEADCVKVRHSGDRLILDIIREDLEPDDDCDDGSGWLAALAQLRADVLAGDLRLFYLLWLTAVEAGTFEPDEPEPMPGIGPLTEALEAFATFFRLDPDLVAAAAERSTAAVAGGTPSPEDARRMIASLSDHEKTGLLVRLFEGDAHVGAELRAIVRKQASAEGGGPAAIARTVGQLQSRAREVRLARERGQAEKRAAERQRQALEAEKARRARLDAIARRGEDAWREIETEIERRNAAGYDRAARLILDLRAIAEQRGTDQHFTRRLQAIRERHARKERFLQRLAGIG